MLQDGTLIDLCGATLLWRSAEGLQNSPVSLTFTSLARSSIDIQTISFSFHSFQDKT